MSENLKDEIKHGLTCQKSDPAHGVVEQAVCLASHPGSMLLLPFFRHFEKKYRGKYRFAKLLFAFDLLLVGIALGLAGAALFFFLYKAPAFEDKILFEADVAPREIVSGAPSTLVMRYTNGTGKTLEHARVRVGFPDHFLLQHIEGNEQPAEEGEVIALGTLEPGAVGTVRIEGVMFGDVGGEQAFTSILTFTRGTKGKPGQKVSAHAFSPARSTLALELNLPERLVASQPMPGSIAYKNTGTIDFPEIAIEPVWPEGFRFTSASLPLREGKWHMPDVKAGTEGVVEFSGVLREGTESATFVFHPSFAFGDVFYRQETLETTVSIVQPQIRLSHSVTSGAARPGGYMETVVRYENTGETPVEELAIALEATSPFAGSVAPVSVGTVDAGASGEVEIRVPIKASISQSSTSTYENFEISTRSRGTYKLGDAGEEQQQVTSYGSSVSTKVTSPAVLRSFGRYTSEQGDQLGRGPLPPLVGEETKYWVFWNLSGTTNALTNVKLTGHLPAGARFTGRQTVSQGDPITYDAATNTITWTASRLTPTFPPGSKIIGVAFEVGITPSETQVGTTPTILTDVRLTATDEFTGAVVTASGAAVTTNLPQDIMAKGLGKVEL
ncbi:hypothetical protein HY734_02315 [Candidatus Uhrbacteria bacterium]|nr:hypothetical protein [Candidatus Uhrbacteria bacterium]